jgi:cell division protein FtsQ
VSRSAAAVERELSTAGIAAPADKRFRRADIRPGRRRRLAFGWRALRVVALVAAGAAAIGAAGTAAVRSNALAIDRVAVHGNVRLSTGEVEGLLGGLRGHNLLSADLERARQRLLDSPWVADARLRRVLPSTVDVTIVERTPMAVARIGRQLYLVDATGVIIDEYGAQYASFDLPIVDGLASGQAGGPLIDATRARFAAQVMAALGVHSTVGAHVSQIDVSNPHDAVVLLDGDPALLHLGDDRFAERLQKYIELAPTLRDQFRNIDYVDLRFGDRWYVHPQGKDAK